MAEHAATAPSMGAATDRDLDAVRELLLAEGWRAEQVGDGATYVARGDGEVIGCVRVVELEPSVFLVDDVMVRADRRGQGVGADLVRVALKGHEGTAYLACHPERLAFYTRLGFWEEAVDRLPPTVHDYLVRGGDIADTEHAREHHFMRRP